MSLLHKFKKYDSSKKSELLDLVQGRLYHAELHQLNDPQEILRPKHDPKIRICSLSSGSNSNYMMWIHYAGAYSGVSVEFKESAIRRAISVTNLEKGIEFQLQKVKYVVELGTDPEQDAVTEKYFQWFYENEYRILLTKYEQTDCRYLEVKPEKVMLGDNLDEKMAEEIRLLCQSKGIPVGTAHPNMSVYNQEGELERYREDLEEVAKHFKSPKTLSLLESK
jgi:hypothetical protein